MSSSACPRCGPRRRMLCRRTGPPTPGWSTGSAGSPPTCASASPTAATCAAPTACRRGAWGGWGGGGRGGLGAEPLPPDDEIVRLIRVAVDLLGVEEVRFTGGEPLLRRGL